ncbi:MAG TPA: hypothetical protein VHY76_01950, partial [Acetobacteraceae bacterium]|nr:hypothetical protein [Acetobacteraceae bacterium]
MAASISTPPYRTSISTISRRDVRDIRAYLVTVQPVRNKVRSDQLPFPFSIRFSMVVWNWLCSHRGAWSPD